jgi:hypothetical protein
MPAMSVIWVREEIVQSAEAAEIRAQSQTGQDVPASKEEKLTTSGM